MMCSTSDVTAREIGRSDIVAEGICRTPKHRLQSYPGHNAAVPKITAIPSAANAITATMAASNGPPPFPLSDIMDDPQHAHITVCAPPREVTYIC